jgi:hypothetical protein
MGENCDVQNFGLFTDYIFAIPLSVAHPVAEKLHRFFFLCRPAKSDSPNFEPPCIVPDVVLYSALNCVS